MRVLSLVVGAGLLSANAVFLRKNKTAPDPAPEPDPAVAAKATTEATEGLGAALKVSENAAADTVGAGDAATVAAGKELTEVEKKSAADAKVAAEAAAKAGKTTTTTAAAPAAKADPAKCTTALTTLCASDKTATPEGVKPTLEKADQDGETCAAVKANCDAATAEADKEVGSEKFCLKDGKKKKAKDLAADALTACGAEAPAADASCGSAP